MRAKNIIENLQSIYLSIHAQNQEAIKLGKDTADKYHNWDKIFSYVEK